MKKVWRINQTSKQSNIAFTSIHMTGNRSYFSNLIECSSRYVTFGDGGKGRILVKGDIIGRHLLVLNDVRYVEGLTAYLISISQLCDQGYAVNFCKENCIITNKGNVEL